MITLRLFKSSSPFQEIDARSLMEGEITVGRDPSADWPLEDSRADLSRRHCVIGFTNGRIWLRDFSKNGVFIGAERRRALQGVEEVLDPGETVRLGEFMLIIDVEADTFVGQAGAPVETSGRASRVQQPADEPSANAPAEAARLPDAALIEAFSRGAGVDPSVFAGEDPDSLMERLGRVYRQTIEDLTSLLNDRAVMRASLDVELTTISARGNNPLKWAPPQKLAVDLLGASEGGFLDGALAIQASFADLRRHGAAMMAGHQSAAARILEELAPVSLSASARKTSLPFASKHENSWRALELRHAELVADLASPETGLVAGAFRRGYEESLSASMEEQAA